MLKMLFLIQDKREKRQVSLVKDMSPFRYELIVLVGIARIWEYGDIQTWQNLYELGFIFYRLWGTLHNIKYSIYFSFYLIVIRWYNSI